MGLGQPGTLVGKRVRQNSENDNNSSINSSHSTTASTELNEDMWILMNKRARELSPEFNTVQTHVQAMPQQNMLPTPRIPLMGFESSNNITASSNNNTTEVFTPISVATNVSTNNTNTISSNQAFTDVTDGSSISEKDTKYKTWSQNVDNSSDNSISKMDTFVSVNVNVNPLEFQEVPLLEPEPKKTEESKNSKDTTTEVGLPHKDSDNSELQFETSVAKPVVKSVSFVLGKTPRVLIKRSKAGKMVLKTSASKDSMKSTSSNDSGTISMEEEYEIEKSDEAENDVNEKTTGDYEDIEDNDVAEDDECEVELDVYDYIPSDEPRESVPGLRQSLFPYVPPYIQFCRHDQVSDQIPPEVRKKMKWRLSSISPLVVRKTVEASGFRLLRNTVEWTGEWGKHMKASLFRSAVKDYQKLNHLPGTFQIGRKDRLWKNCHRFMLRYGKEEFGFIPRTYCLPKETKQLKQAWFSKEIKGSPWIIKPPAGARGTGIRVINKFAQIPKKKSIIVQKYIKNPLLINERKFDLRLYVLVTSMHPLKIYLYNDGLVRFAPVKYSTDKTRVSDRYMHLTNYSINKNCELYTQNEDVDACTGHKWTLKSLWKYLREAGKDVDNILARIQDIVVKTILCAEDPITSVAFNMPNRYTGYELFGFDVILDEDLKPWLLEVNISPSLHSNSPLDLAVKGPLIAELFNIVGYHLPPHLSSTANGQKNIFRKMNQPNLNESIGTKFNILLYSGTLTKQAKAKHTEFRSCYNQRDKYIENILTELTPDDVRHLITAVDEMSQCIGFQRIFPSKISHEYFPYFEGPRYYNMLFDAWEYKYGFNNAESIQRLVDLCETKMHYQGVVSSSSTVKLTSSDQSPQPASPNKKVAAANLNPNNEIVNNNQITTKLNEEDSEEEEDEEELVDSNYCSMSTSERTSESNSSENLFIPQLASVNEEEICNSLKLNNGNGDGLEQQQDNLLIAKAAGVIKGVC